MSINPNEDTEFNDALRKHGIIPELEPTPPSPSPPPSPTFDDLLNDFTPSELRELGEDAADDDTGRIIDNIRRKRIAEDRAQEKGARFGRVYPIGREDYTREVTDASNTDAPDDDEEQGTGVVCLLYKDGIPRSDRTFEQIRLLASQYPRTKFVSIVGDKCIPNLPDARIPMIIVYKKGDIKNQLVGWGADRERQVQELEALLMVTGAIDIPDRPPPRERRDYHSSDEEDEEDIDASSRMRSAGTATNGRTRKNIRSSAKPSSDSDSDFDFDI